MFKFIDTVTNTLLTYSELKSKFVIPTEIEIEVEVPATEEGQEPTYVTEIVSATEAVSFPRDPDSPSVDAFLDGTQYKRIVDLPEPVAQEGFKYVRGEPSYVPSGSVYVTNWLSVELTEDEIAGARQVLNSFLENLRWEKEVGGITVGQLTIPTRDRDKTLINGKITEILLTGAADTDTFKFTINGTEMDMTVGTVKQIGIAIAQHVQKCIDAASLVRPDILSGALTTEEAVRTAYNSAFDTL